MQILQVNTQDRNGGAAQIARQLFEACRRKGHASHFAVGTKYSDDADVFEIPNNSHRNVWANPWRTLQQTSHERHIPVMPQVAHWLANLGELRRWSELRRGLEDFNFPGTSHLFEALPQLPDIVHLHNLHGNYFDLRMLPEFSQRRPTVITLHDEWAFTGHCGYTLGCERWEIGCGQCPHLSIYPAIPRDASSDNWRRKRDIYARSQLYVASPSQWLMDRAMRSIVGPAITEARVIPNGIDLSVFHPGDKQSARRALGLPQGASVVLFIGNKTRSNDFKDYATMEAAVKQVPAQRDGKELIFLCLGEEAPEERVGPAVIRFMNYQNDAAKVAQFYQASDVYLHAAKAEAFGLVIAEALACGLPVVATAVGGIPEIVENGVTGFLVPTEDSISMAAHIQKVLEDVSLRRFLSAQGVDSARQRFSLERMVNDYLKWYEEILEGSGN